MASRDRPVWIEDSKPIESTPLSEDSQCDVLVVGGGIAGLSAAYEAAQLGRSVIVIDRGEIGHGMTAHTTAHLSSQSDDWNHKLIDVHGYDGARTNYESQVAAINRIETICEDGEIDADFKRVDGYLVPASPDHDEQLEQEYQACRKIGMEVDWTTESPIPLGPSGRALRFSGQARIHPLKYCSGLARAIEGRDGRLHPRTPYVDHDEDDEGVTIETGGGNRIRAAEVMFATNSPVNATIAVHTKQVPMRTYAIAARIASGSTEDALLWDTCDAYHYVRIQPGGSRGDWLIVGGEDHRSGTADDGEERYLRLEQWARERFPQMGDVGHRWTGQVMEPADFLPFSGRTPGSKRTYLHSGDSGMGMTNAVAGALNFAALLEGGKAHLEDLFDPSRKPASGTAIGEYARGLGGVVANLAEYVTPGEVDSADVIRPGEGAVIRRGAAKIAAYRNSDGTLIERSAKCTHMGCIVHWNGAAGRWDCPCHGSQFAPDGKVLNAPALRPLARIED